MNSVSNTSTGRIPVERDRVAGLVRAFVDLEALAAILEHLWHDRHAVESPPPIEGAQYLVFAPNFDPVSNLRPTHTLASPLEQSCASSDDDKVWLAAVSSHGRVNDE
jgi:hypothetical protein